MCWCTPEMKTPWCGKPGCEMPVQNSRPTAGGQLIIVEKWKDGSASEEIRYFVMGAPKTFVLAFNPALVPEDVIIRMLKGLGYKV